MKVTLASASPRRRELIKKIPQLDVDFCVSGADESAITESDPTLLVKKLASVKAASVAARTEGVVIGADTVVAIDGKILGKPRDEREAQEFFKLLCGRTHAVITGIAVIDGNRMQVASESTLVTFNGYDAEIVDRYIKSGSPFDKAGGYGIQDELLKPLIANVQGSLDNVIGLPVELLRTTLEEIKS